MVWNPLRCISQGVVILSKEKGLAVMNKVTPGGDAYVGNCMADA